MSSPGDRIFSFISKGIPEDTFKVVQFEGGEGISRLYRFDITLVSENPEIDIEKIMETPAEFHFDTGTGETLFFSGILTDFEQKQNVDEYTFYRVSLAPKLWWSTQFVQNQVFLNQTTPEIIETVLQQTGLTSLDYEFRLVGDYSKKWEFVCQYKESHFHFMSRWLEWEGMYFFFEYGQAGEKMIITDSKLAAESDLGVGSLVYNQAHGHVTDPFSDQVHAWRSCHKKTPRQVMLKDYNYRHPSLEISGQADISAKGAGDIYLYGGHIQSPAEAERLARVRAEEHICREKRFSGESRSPRVRSGRIIELEEHYRSDYNTRYLVVEVEHQGHQASYLTAGLREELAELEKKPLYFNRTQSVLATVQYRPELITEKTRIFGTLSAKIDAAGSGKYAELDEQGRYKVILPFDLSGRGGGKASTWLRMAQPYAGSNHGMHFPLHKGAEVLLTFIDGDPDRPIISAAVPNPEHPSPVHAGNATRAGFQTSGGGSFHFENMEGKERIVMHSGDGRSHFSLGKGSPAESVMASDHNIQFSAVAGSQLSGLLQTLHAYKHSTQLVGFKWLQVLMVFLEELIVSLPELASAITVAKKESDGDSPDDATESDAVKWVEGISALVTPILALTGHLVTHSIQAKILKKYFTNTGKMKDLGSHPAFFVGHVNDGGNAGTITRLSKDGKNIVLGTTEGDIHAFAEEDMVSTAKNIELNAGETLDLVTSTGTITLNCLSKTTDIDKTDTTLTMKKGETKFNSKHKSPTNATEIVFDHLKKGPHHRIKTTGSTGSTNTFTQYAEKGPQNKTSLNTPNSMISLIKYFDNNGPRVFGQVKKAATKAIIQVKYDGGFKTTANAGKQLDLSGETITIASKEGTTEKASIQLKTDGSALVHGTESVTVKAKNGTGQIICQGTWKAGPLVVRDN